MVCLQPPRPAEGARAQRLGRRGDDVHLARPPRPGDRPRRSRAPKQLSRTAQASAAAPPLCAPGRSRSRVALSVLEPGSQVQNAIYAAGGAGVADRAGGLGGARPGGGRARPVRVHRRRRRLGGEQRARTSRRSSGAGCGRGCSPGTAERDLSVEVLGTRSPVPFLLAPIGVLSIATPRRGARCRARRGGDGRADDPLERRLDPRWRTSRPSSARRRPWFQLYWFSDREIAGSLVDRAAPPATARSSSRSTRSCSAGGRATCGLGYLPFLRGEGLAQFFSDPGSRRAPRRAARGGRPHRPRCARSCSFPNLALTLGRPRMAARPNGAADPRQGGAHRRGRAGSRSSTASTGSSSRTTAGGRWTARSPRSTRLTRCATPPLRTRRS